MERSIVLDRDVLREAELEASMFEEEVYSDEMLDEILKRYDPTEE